MDKLTERLYNEYKSKVVTNDLTHSVYYEMATALLNKGLRAYANQLQILNEIQEIGHTTKYAERISEVNARVEALIALITDLTVECIELFLQEDGETE